MPIKPIAVVREVIDEYKSHIRTEFRARDKKLREALKRELDAPIAGRKGRNGGGEQSSKRMWSDGPIRYS